MLDRLKGIGGQIGEAVGGVAATVKDGAGTVAQAASGAVAQAASGAARSAGQAVGAINEAATRESITRMRDTLAIAVEELRKRPVSARPVTLVAKVDLVVTSLEIQMVFDPSDPAPPLAGPVVITPPAPGRRGSTPQDPPAG